jgi:hypothetical protein
VSVRAKDPLARGLGRLGQAMACEVNMRPKQRGRLHTESESASFSGNSHQTSRQAKRVLS